MTKQHVSWPALLLSIALMFLSTNLVQSQNSKDRSIVGSWLFSSQFSFSKMDKKADDHLKKNPQLRARIQSAYTGKRITFFANGDYSQVLANGKEATGQWQVQDTSLVIASPAGIKYYYTYRFQGNILIISSTKKTANSISVVPDQYFTKLKN